MALSKLICPKCMAVHFVDEDDPGACPHCHIHKDGMYNFKNSDDYLQQEVPRVLKERKSLGLEGLVGGLDCAIINTEPENLLEAVEQYLRYTGLSTGDRFEDDRYRTWVLEASGSPSLILRSRMSGDNPFLEFNTAPKAGHLPNTRFETFVFETSDLERYLEIQTARGVEFIEPFPLRADRFLFAQTIPSAFHGCSIGLIEWKPGERHYRTPGSRSLEMNPTFDKKPYTRNIFELDHTATRVHAEHRDRAIIEFMELTNYTFSFAIYVKTFNSITNVARLSPEDFAMVFTSGILPDSGGEDAGPTEKYIRNYGTRVHHMAFRTENIEGTFEALKADEMGFLLELVGSSDDGLKQTFTEQFSTTLLVNEYIHRYGDFDGFFTKGNVTLLTEATDRQ